MSQEFVVCSISTLQPCLLSPATLNSHLFHWEERRKVFPCAVRANMLARLAVSRKTGDATLLQGLCHLLECQSAPVLMWTPGNDTEDTPHWGN